MPDAIGSLVQLETLFPDNNKLTALPTGLRALTKLEKLYLHGNDALNIPPEVLGPNWNADISKTRPMPADIPDYYFREKRPLLEAKLILVGLGGVGKTSLVKRLVERSFDPNEQKTETSPNERSRPPMDKPLS